MGRPPVGIVGMFAMPRNSEPAQDEVMHPQPGQLTKTPCVRTLISPVADGAGGTVSAKHAVVHDGTTAEPAPVRVTA